MPPAARVTDKVLQAAPHCHAPIHPAALVPTPVPHPAMPLAIIGPGALTVMIGGMPAARVGDMAVCVGPPDVIVLGSFKVLIGGQPAARLGDMTAHGGAIVMGCPTVLIG